jgi:hypothetical protein
MDETHIDEPIESEIIHQRQRKESIPEELKEKLRDGFASMGFNFVDATAINDWAVLSTYTFKDATLYQVRLVEGLSNGGYKLGDFETLRTLDDVN